MSILQRVRDLGFERPRLALALLSLAFFGLVYLLVGLNAPAGWGPAFLALCACYLTAFVALVCEAFWARWFASGLGWSGFMVGVASLVMMGWQAPLAIYTAIHLVVLGGLWGGRMAALFEGQSGWRSRYGMDEHGVTKLGKTITRASASLPTLIIWALAPKQGQGVWLLEAAALALGILGLRGLLRARTWSLVALAGAAGIVAARPAPDLFGHALWVAPDGTGLGTIAALATVAALAAAVLPFARPAWRYLRSLP
jgi:hypothetical protein